MRKQSKEVSRSSHSVYSEQGEMASPLSARSPSLPYFNSMWLCAIRDAENIRTYFCLCKAFIWRSPPPNLLVSCQCFLVAGDFKHYSQGEVRAVNPAGPLNHEGGSQEVAMVCYHGKERKSGDGRSSHNVPEPARGE